uniref:ATPase H+ transporting accessory protein 1 n=1 Tax=Crocodylus porosus TaxID=8502 RepID=A0A7M4FXQ0_CROPO
KRNWKSRFWFYCLEPSSSSQLLKTKRQNLSLFPNFFFLSLSRFLMTKKFFAASARNWFTLETVEIVQDNRRVARFNVSVISAPAEYSFHCQLVGTSNLYGVNLIPSNNEAKSWDVFISEFQIQGFSVENNQFSYASDCTSFFSPGIWMALVTSIILLWILTYGIHMIMQLTTNSRFDDPKGSKYRVVLVHIALQFIAPGCCI